MVTMDRLGSLFLASTILLIFVIVPVFSVQAQAKQFPGDEGVTGLVPCGDENEPPCEVCHVTVLVQELIRFAVYIAVFVATLLIAYAGFKMITAQGDTSAVTRSKDILIKAVLGLVFVLSAWLIVDTLMKVFYDSAAGTFGPWNVIRCVAQPKSTTPSSSSSVGSIKVGPPTYEPKLEAWDPSIPIKPEGACSASMCQIDSMLSDRLVQFKNELNGRGLSEDSWWVTEAYPPTIQHRNICHKEGTCVDANFRKTSASTASNIIKAQESADISGLWAIYEVTTDVRKSELIKGGVSPINIQVVQGINGEHFSVYKK